MNQTVDWTSAEGVLKASILDPADVFIPPGAKRQAAILRIIYLSCLLAGRSNYGKTGISSAAKKLGIRG